METKNLDKVRQIEIFRASLDIYSSVNEPFMNRIKKRLKNEGEV